MITIFPPQSLVGNQGWRIYRRQAFRTSERVVMSQLQLSHSADGTAVVDEIELSYPADGVAIIALQGEHDLATRQELRSLLAAEIKRNRVVVVDVSDAEFIDSSVISNLLRADRVATARGARFVLQMGTAPIVRRVLEISGLLDHLNVAHTRAEAIDQPVSALAHQPRRRAR